MHMCGFAWLHGVHISQTYPIQNYIKHMSTISINLYRTICFDMYTKQLIRKMLICHVDDGMLNFTT